jgi:MFS family permease
MKHSIISQLVKKDLLIMRKTIFTLCVASLVFAGITGLLFGRIPHWAFINLAFILLMAPAVTCGLVLITKTIVMEKEKSTQLFIMSLPVTVKEFTLSKLLVNVPIFFTLWLLGSSLAFYFAFGLGFFPFGTLPFLSILFLGILVAYIGILCMSFVFQSHGVTAISNLIFSMGTAAYLWIIVYLDPIEMHIYGQVSLWNSTAISIVATQMMVALAAVLITWNIQTKKRDFI